MDSKLLLYVMTAAVSITAIAFVLQLVFLFKLTSAIKNLQVQAKELTARLNPMIDKAMITLEESRRQISEVATKANEVLDMSRKQLMTIDGVLSDASMRTKVQMERAELVIDDAMARFQETIAVLQGGFMRPIREVSGLVAGFRAGLSQLLRGGRPNVAQATQDDEMFI